MEHLLRATAAAEAHHFWFRGFRRFVTPFLEQATRGLSDAKLLDCGCGTGANLDLLEHFGRAWGFDITHLGLLIGREAGRTRLARATVAAAPFPTETFDVVTSFDVLYGLPEPIEQQAVAEMYRVTKPGGCMVINVAAMRVLRGDHSVLGEEVRRYTRSSLERLVVGAGFRIERLIYTNASLFVPMLLIRTAQRLRGLAESRETSRDMMVPPAPVNAMLDIVLRVESWWLRFIDNPFGSSLLCLARKPW